MKWDVASLAVWGRPVLEIAILAVVIYQALRFVRGTRGWPVVLGFILSLLTLGVVIYVLDLQVLRWLLGTFSAFVAVAALVIFQPELRHMLAQVGKLPLFATPQEQRESIEVIIKTCERLSEVKIGALIAIEQSIRLIDVVESGIPVDCEATPEILECIFFPNNAIHDGGVLIKGDRITHAACIFPLSRRGDLDPTLGTRHRAALGLSEETDAVVVVVSEETGAISYAYGGQLVRGVSLEQLRAFLTETLIRPVRARGWIAWLRQRLERPRPAPAVLSRQGSVSPSSNSS